VKVREATKEGFLAANVHEHRLPGLGGAALARTGLSFVPNGPASSFFLLYTFDVLV